MFLYDDRTNVPHYTVLHKNRTVYHIIHWARHGTFCDLVLNEQYEYHVDIPEGLPVCEECLRVKAERGGDPLSVWKNTNQEVPQGVDNDNNS